MNRSCSVFVSLGFGGCTILSSSKSTSGRNSVEDPVYGKRIRKRQDHVGSRIALRVPHYLKHLRYARRRHTCSHRVQSTTGRSIALLILIRTLISFQVPSSFSLLKTWWRGPHLPFFRRILDIPSRRIVPRMDLHLQKHIHIILPLYSCLHSSCPFLQLK